MRSTSTGGGRQQKRVSLGPKRDPGGLELGGRELFGGHTQSQIDKFARCDWTPGPDGVPLLKRVDNRFVGRRHAWLDPGSDHVCLILRPVLADRGGSSGWLRLADASDIVAGHDAEERQRPG